MGAIGIGTALRSARVTRGKSIEQVSRETRIRSEYLQALEGERFEALIGDVYVRGFLRSYSTYLGLDADKVVTVYNRQFGPPRPTLPEPAPGPARSRRHHPQLPGMVRHHPSWTFLVGTAVLVLAVFSVVGLLSRSRSAPAPEASVAPRASIPVLPPSVVVTLSAASDVRAVITVDGERIGPAELPGGVIKEGQGLSFEGASRIDVWLERGGAVAMNVNGHRIGRPGVPASPYQASFTPTDFRGSTSASSPDP